MLVNGICGIAAAVGGRRWRFPARFGIQPRIRCKFNGQFQNGIFGRGLRRFGGARPSRQRASSRPPHDPPMPLDFFERSPRRPSQPDAIPILVEMPGQGRHPGSHRHRHRPMPVRSRPVRRGCLPRSVWEMDCDPQPPLPHQGRLDPHSHSVAIRMHHGSDFDRVAIDPEPAHQPPVPQLERLLDSLQVLGLDPPAIVPIDQQPDPAQM